jgi:hypothetical protein
MDDGSSDSDVMEGILVYGGFSVKPSEQQLPTAS